MTKGCDAKFSALLLTPDEGVKELMMVTVPNWNSSTQHSCSKVCKRKSALKSIFAFKPILVGKVGKTVMLPLQLLQKGSLLSRLQEFRIILVDRVSGQTVLTGL